MTGKMQFPRLFEPGRIGKLVLKNRIVMEAMDNKLIELDGRLSQRAIDFYACRAKGGTGLIITCAARSRQVEQPPFTPLTDAPVVDNKIYVGRLSEVAEAVHDYGAKVALQVTPGRGRALRSKSAVAPSRLPIFEYPDIITRELTTEEVEQMVRGFRLIAEVARSAEMDAIEINAHSGYICDEFLTALWNKRTDKYGGDLTGRLRFLLEIIENIREGAGTDFPIIVKYALTHYLEGGREIEEGLEIARRLEAAGVSALDIDAGCYETLYWPKPTTYSPPGCMVDLAEKVKGVVSIPVIAVGKLGYPELAEKVLEARKADFIGLARPLLSDPDWANKVKEGEVEYICPCVGDYEGCNGRLYKGNTISCTVNPACGNERELAVGTAERKKRVLVVGGGPGGMEAAMVAASRGHNVTLWEKAGVLGGNLVPASVPGFKQDYRMLIDYFSAQLKRLGVTVELGKEATPELIQRMKPEAVFIATGSAATVPGIRGIESSNVVMAVDLLLGKREAGERVVVLGGGFVGCETGLYLAQQGKKVIIVAASDSVMRDMISINRMHMLKLLADAGVKILTGSDTLEITDDCITIADKHGKRSTLKADTVVLAKGFAPDRGLLEALKEVPEMYPIGDCVEPRNVMSAIREGFRLARLV